MIFVILGICVLVASFLIALVSLVREQGKLIEEAKRDEEENTPISNKLKVKEKVVLQKAEPVVGEVLESKPAVVDAGTPAINRPLFPWEEGKYQSAGNITDADREKVEMLRAQLAELKSRVVTKTPARDETQEIMVKPGGEQEQEPGPPQAQPQNQNLDQKKDQVQQNLSGEISIDDLKKQ